MSSDGGGESLYLLDAHSLIFQVFHALPEMTSPAGLPTNAVFGFAKDLFFLRRERKPSYILAVFDAAGPTFRDEIVSDYKAQRAPMPDDLKLQMPIIRELLQVMGVPLLEKTGFEADDLIATLAGLGERRGLDVYICSSDKDCRQLLTDRVRVFNLRKQIIYDRTFLLNDWGIAPEQVIDYQTLVGDSVDNIKGVPGVGPKTATKLLQEFKTLDNLYANLDRVQGKIKERLEAARDIIAPTRKLVRLVTDVPVDEQWDRWKLGTWESRPLLEFFTKCGFQRLQEQVRTALDGPPTSIAPPAPRESNPVQGSLFSEQMENGVITPVTGDDWQATYHLVNTPERFADFYAKLKDQPRFAMDLETTNLEPRRAEIVGMAFSWQAGEGWYVALKGPPGDSLLDPAEVLASVKPLLENPLVAKVNQNIKYDTQVLRQSGVHLAGIVGDSMVADYLLHAGERSHGMDALAVKHLNHRVIPITDLIGKGKNQKRMDEVPCAQVAEYAGEDADVAWRLCEKLEPMLQELRFKRGPHETNGQVSDSTTSKLYLYDELEIPLIEVLADMEFNGIRLDVPLLAGMSKEMTVSLAGLEDDIFRLAGRPFNIGSVKQLREILFSEQGFKSDRRTAITGAASTDQAALERLAREGHELPKKLLEHRRIAKLKSTYVDALPLLVNPQTGRVHASFNQTVASTGRLSSSDPNLQNIPIRSEQGGQIRQSFIPEPGWSLIAADYSQIELRLLAHFCGDENLQKAFADDRDIHASVASQIFSIPEGEVNDTMRRMAKTVNFGVIYGISPFGLAPRLEISKEEASTFIDNYFARYPRVLAYQTDLLENCIKNGYVETILGRRRAIQGVRYNSNYRNRNQPEREAINMQIQGSAADLIKIAMLRIHRKLRDEKRQARLLLQIHDELVLESPPEELDDILKMVRTEMSGALADQVKVPLKVDVSVGGNWLDVKEVGA